MYAAVNGHMDDVAPERIGEFEERLVGYLETSKPDVMKSIEDTKDIDEATDASLKEGIGAFKATFS